MPNRLADSTSPYLRQHAGKPAKCLVRKGDRVERGDKIAAARLALQTALHGLAAGDRFMLLAFDDRLERFEDGLIEYDGASLARADAWVRRLEPRGELRGHLSAGAKPVLQPGVFVVDRARHATGADQVLGVVEREPALANDPQCGPHRLRRGDRVVGDAGQALDLQERVDLLVGQRGEDRLADPGGVQRHAAAQLVEEFAVQRHFLRLPGPFLACIAPDLAGYIHLSPVIPLGQTQRKALGLRIVGRPAVDIFIIFADNDRLVL